MWQIVLLGYFQIIKHIKYTHWYFNYKLTITQLPEIRLKVFGTRRG